MRYALYCRKSTEAEDRQILSIESQEAEVRRAFESVPGIDLTAVYRESFSAKAPGRPIFDQMLRDIEHGKADGIIAWHPDRLARNALDGGRIIHLLDRGSLKDLKFANFSFENNAQGKFMLSIIFGYSKYYVDNLSQNVKRGNRAKVERGWRPGSVPLGYRHDRETKTIVPDGEHFVAVKRLFALMLTGGHSVRSVLRIATEEWGYRMPMTRRFKGRQVAQSTLYKIFENPFYAGYFHWDGRLYPGKHEPMITMDEFRRVRQMIERVGTEKPQRYTFPYTGLIRCGACGLSVTAEHKVNRFGSRYVYYHCTRKNRGQKCAQPSIEGRNLDSQVREFIGRVHLDAETLRDLTAIIAMDVHEDDSLNHAHAERDLRAIDAERGALLDLQLKGHIDESEFVERRRALDIERAAVSDRVAAASRPKEWIEPAELLISFNDRLASWFARGSDAVKRQIIRTVGSNPTLADRKLSAQATKPFMLRAEEPVFLYGCGQGDDIRTRFEHRDPGLLKLVEEIRETIRLVEADAAMANPSRLPLAGSVPRGRPRKRVRPADLLLRPHLPQHNEHGGGPPLLH